MAIKITTLALFASTNPTLASGDYGIESDTGHHKYGDGVTAWNDLVYYGITSDFIRQLVNEINTTAPANGTKVSAKSADYSMVYTDGTILVTTGASNVTITLPSIQTTAYTFNGATYYRIYNIKKVDSGAGKVIVTPASGTIDGETNIELISKNDAIPAQADGSNWFIIS